MNFAAILVIAFNSESPLLKEFLHRLVVEFLPDHSFRVIYPSLLVTCALTNNELASLVFADPRRGGVLTHIVGKDFVRVVIEVPDSHA